MAGGDGIKARWRDWWQAAEAHPRSVLAAAVVLLLLLGCAIVRVGVFEDPLPQFELGAREFATTHHIGSTFLPIGYALVLGFTEALGAHWGTAGEHACMYAVHIAMLAGGMLMARALLRRAMPATAATVTAFVLSLHPEILQKLKKVSDTDLTLLLLLAVLLACVRLRERATWGRAVTAGLVLGAGLLVRPNLALMVALVVWAVWPRGWGERLGLAAASVVVMAASYAAVTGAVHGRPFFPQNGAYNAYAGANKYTEATLLKMLNAEDSIPQDMRDRGFSAPVNWLRPSDQPGVNDGRDLHWEPLYSQWARAYMRAHPGEMVKLDALKFVTLLRPETKRYKFTDPQTAGSALWLANKALQAMVVPVWLLLLAWSRMKRLRLGSVAVMLLAAAYVLPFVIVNADPRFRVPLDALLLVDIARMLYLRRRGARGAGGEAQVFAPDDPLWDGVGVEGGSAATAPV